MGMIHDDHGKISIETRRESFIIHAGYGYKQAERPVGQQRPGDNVRLDGYNWTIHALYADHACLHRLDVPNMSRDVLLDVLVGIDAQDVDESDSIGSLWREYPHPEFANEDLYDLIAALIDVRDK